MKNNKIPYVFNPMGQDRIPLKHQTGVWVYTNNNYTGDVVVSVFHLNNYTIGSGTSPTALSMEVLDRGEVRITTVNGGANMYVKELGSATATNINKGGTLTVSGYYYYDDNNGEEQIIDRRANIQNTTINSSGKLNIYGPANVQNTTINNGGEMYVSGSHYYTNINQLTVQNGGKLYLKSGARTSSIQNGTVSSGGNLYISSGATTSMNIDGGKAYFYQSGSGFRITASNGAVLYVSSGGVIRSGSIYPKNAANSGAATYTQVHVYNSGVASNIHLYGSASVTSARAYMYVSSGGVISGCVNEGTTNSGGVISLANGGKAYDCITSTYNFGVNSGASAIRPVTRGVGQISIAPGGIVIDPIMSAGTISGQSNTTISGGTILGGVMYVWGTADGVKVPQAGGYLCPKDKSTVSTVNAYSATGTATNLTLGPGASSIVSGGRLIGCEMTSNAKLYLRPGIENEYDVANQGRAEQVHVSGGVVYISAGTLTSSFIQGNIVAGQVVVSNGGFVESCSAAYGPNNISAHFAIYSGNAQNIVLSAGGKAQTNGVNARISYMTVSSGGMGYIYNAGSGTNILVEPNGTLQVKGSGTAKSYITSCSTSITGGTIDIQSGGIATSIEAQRSKVLVSSAGIASNLNHYNSTNNTPATEQVVVMGGGTCINIAQYGGGGNISPGITGSANSYISGLTASSYNNTAPYIVTAGTITNFNQTSGWLYGNNGAKIESGTATRVTVRANNGANYNSMTISSTTFDVNAGGKASNTIISQGGIMRVNSAGSINGATVISGGSMVLLSGSTISNFGLTNISSEGHLIVSSGGTFDINDDFTGQIASFDTANITSSSFSIYSQSVVQMKNMSLDVINMSNNDTYLFISGGLSYVDHSEIFDGAQQHLIAGASCSYSWIQDWAQFHVSSGGRLEYGDLYQDGFLVISNGGVANEIYINEFGAKLIVKSGGSALNIYDYTQESGNIEVENGGYIAYAPGYEPTPTEGVLLYSDNTCSETIISSGMTLEDAIGSGRPGCGMMVLNNGLASGVNIYNTGKMYIMSGGSAFNPSIWSGGSMTISSGGSAFGTTILGGGTLIVKSGAVAEECDDRGGNITVEPGGEISYD